MRVQALVLVVALAANVACAARGGGRAHRAAPRDLPATDAPPPARYTFELVRAYPHDRAAFTQGLVFDGGALYEGTGLKGESTLRRVDLESGKVLRKVDLDPEYFGEGVAVLGGAVYQLTWTSGVGFVYDASSFERRGEFRYEGQGWGLTHDGSSLILSDGSQFLRFIDPKTMTVTRRVAVTLAGAPLGDLNELEYVDGEVWANVWMSDWIARIDPATGRVTGIVELAGLIPEGGLGDQDVLNGIAYDAARRRLFVTGKRWPSLFEIRVVPAGSPGRG